MIDQTLLAGLAGVLLSLLFSYVPGAEGWFSDRKPVEKRLVMLGLLVLSALLLMAASCTNLYDVGIACNQQGITDLIRLFLVAFVSNQSTYVMSARSPKEMAAE